MALGSGRKKFHLFTVPAERADSYMPGEIAVRQARSWLVGSGRAHHLSYKQYDTTVVPLPVLFLTFTVPALECLLCCL